jgi:hypothetical protein
MTDHPLGPHRPVTITCSEHEWHMILRELVYSASTQEKVLHQVLAGGDPKRDAWAIAVVRQLEHTVSATDKALELLQESQARPVPG